MTIAPATRGGLLILVCLLSSGCSKDKRVEAVANAVPYISAALSQPMPVLYGKAANGNDAADMLRLGLALAAGRMSPVSPADADLKSLAPIDLRFQAAKRAWLKENPPGSEGEVPWARQIGLTADEGAAVTRIEIATSADYWLSMARQATTTRVLAPGFSTPHGTASEVDATVPAIDTRILLTAEACVDAVRQSAHARVPALPEVVLRLWKDGVGLSVGQAVSDPTRLKPGRDYAVGPAACGTPDTFNRYVALLRKSL